MLEKIEVKITAKPEEYFKLMEHVNLLAQFGTDVRVMKHVDDRTNQVVSYYAFYETENQI